VPFCAHKCEYCAFYSEASSGELINRYVAALVREMELVANDLKPRTVFFGGGTPSILNLRQWETILKTMGAAKFARRERMDRRIESRHGVDSIKRSCGATTA
jgi:oxygen-independent coproporphyrinogen-3 oxidase